MEKELEKSYIDAVQELKRKEDEFDNNERRKEIVMKIKELRAELSEMERIQNEYVGNEQATIDDALKEMKKLYYPREKTLRGELLELNFRVTKSFIPEDKKMIVETLRSTNKIDEGIGTFKKPFLRKLADVGVLPPESYRWDERVNMKVTIL